MQTLYDIIFVNTNIEVIQMAFSYEKLFQLAKIKGLNKTELRELADISTATLAKLSKNENVGMDILEKLCIALNCQPGDILSYTLETKNKLLNILRDRKSVV